MTTEPTRPGQPLARLLVGLVTVAVVVATVVAGGVAWLQQRDAVRERAQQQLAGVAGLQAARVEALVEALRANVTLVASRTQLRREVAAATAGDPAAAARATTILGDAMAATPTLLEVTIVDPDGVVIVSTDRSLLGDDLSGDADVAAGQAAVWTGGLALRDGQVVHRLAGPLELDGVGLGTALLTVDGEALTQLFADRTGLGDTGETLLGADLPDTGRTFITRRRFDDRSGLFLPVTADVPMSHALDGRTTVEPGVDYRGVDVLAATAPAPPHGWGVVAKADVAELDAPLGQLARQLAMAALIAAILGAALAALMARRIAQPVRALDRAASRLADGDRSVRAEPAGAGELRQLGEAFNRMADAIDDARSGLESTVQARTRDLATALEDIEGRNADLETFARVLAHDLRSPVASVRGLLAILRTGDVDEATAEDIMQRVDDALDRMSSLIGDVLQLLKVSAVNVEPTVTRLTDVVAEVAAGVESDATVEVVGDATIRTDPGVVRMVLRNLIDNAVRYHGDAPAAIQVSVAATDGGATVAVHDRGVGVDPRDVAEIFVPFTRGRRTSSVDGTGLGLAIAQRLATALGGQLTYEDRAGGGSTFRLTLPEAGGD